MLSIILAINLLLQVEVFCVQISSYSLLTPRILNRNFVYDVYKYDVIQNLVLNETTEQILDFHEDDDEWLGYPTRVHISSNDTLDGEFPLFITATQQKGVSSWEVPLVVDTGRGNEQFNTMARTLCPHDAGPNVTTIKPPLIQITTSNPRNVTVGIKVRRVKDFFVEVNKDVHLNATPSTPKYFYFSFDSEPWNSTHPHLEGILPFNYTIPKNVILIIESDDDICATVSIQNNSCPVTDNEQDRLHQGYHFTMSAQGGVTLTQTMFPRGFYIVFMVKQSDAACTGEGGAAGGAAGRAAGGDRRLKGFRFRVIATVSYKEYLTGALVAVALVLTVYALVVLLAYVHCRCSDEVVVVEAEAGPSSSRMVDGVEPSDVTPILCAQADESDTGSEPDEAHAPPAEPAPAAALTLADLCRARPKAHTKRSDRYFWSTLTVATVYALPVVQLLGTYQRMVLQTGDQDLCYYNFLCAHPLLALSDFNHVFSNVAYVLLGLAFMAQVAAHQRRVHQELGVPSQPGLLYSMGAALVMEGVLSACYHLCPNKMNFQFDSSFMYVIAVLCMLQLYGNRHPDVNANSHATFMVLAFIMAMGLLGIMYPSVQFWAAFTALHLLACTALTLNIYYVGRLKLEWSVVGRAWGAVRVSGRSALLPRYRARAVLLAIANVANWALAAYGLYEHNKDFAKHLLKILMGNAILYTLFYVSMKLLHRERLPARAWLYALLAHGAWALAAVEFKDSRTKWAETPAQSRTYNAVCSALGFYDSHDVWHLASAAAVFLSYNLLLTVDDLLVHTPRHKIPVF